MGHTLIKALHDGCMGSGIKGPVTHRHTPAVPGSLQPDRRVWADFGCLEGAPKPRCTWVAWYPNTRTPTHAPSTNHQTHQRTPTADLRSHTPGQTNPPTYPAPKNTRLNPSNPYSLVSTSQLPKPQPSPKISPEMPRQWRPWLALSTHLSALPVPPAGTAHLPTCHAVFEPILPPVMLLG